MHLICLMRAPPVLSRRFGSLLTANVARPRTYSAILMVTFRRYATHRDPLPSELSRSLDQKPRDTRTPEYVGPFSLGVSPPQLNRGETVKKWSELSTGGKVIRTTARTSNLIVILLGAGLSVALIYALTTDLFSRNSASVLQNEACEKIKSSSEVSKYLRGPLSFHNDPPSTIRPRHRNRHVASQIFVDRTGREHMRLRFYVQGRPPGPSPSSVEPSTLDSLVEWSRTKAVTLSELTLEESVAWIKEYAAHVRDRSKRLFRYLSGKPLPPPSLPAVPPLEENVSSENSTTGVWSLAGLFSSLRGPKSQSSVQTTTKNDQVWTEGEVHVELTMDNQGYFIFRRIYVDMPNSQVRSPKRVFVERTW